MRQWRILDAAVPAERAHWLRMWEESPTQLPFAHPGYGEVVVPDDGRLLAAALDSADGRVLYPFILRGIAGTRGHDIVSPYGYGGPLVWATDDRGETARRFWSEFEAWAEGMSVVSEFVRLSLFDDVLYHPGRIRPRLVNYVRELPATAEGLWAGFEPKVRQNVRRAKRSGLTTGVDRTGGMLDEFLRIYHGTMTRLGSEQWYRFDRAFFAHLHRELPGRLVYVYAVHEGRPVSVDLILLGADTAYYFLGGTDADAFRLRPNELVKTVAMEFAREIGCSHYVLGGGVVPGDGLERYKRGFAPEGARMFCSAERILDPEAYEGLVGVGSEACGPHTCPAEPEPRAAAFFPEYRSPNTADLVERLKETVS